MSPHSHSSSAKLWYLQMTDISYQKNGYAKAVKPDGLSLNSSQIKLELKASASWCTDLIS